MSKPDECFYCKLPFNMRLTRIRLRLLGDVTISLWAWKCATCGAIQQAEPDDCPPDAEQNAP
jgi:hypothetical protein